MKIIKKFFAVITVVIMMLSVFLQNFNTYADAPKQLDSGFGKKVNVKLREITINGGQYLYKDYKWTDITGEKEIKIDITSTTGFRYISDSSEVPSDKIPKIVNAQNPMTIMYDWEIADASDVKLNDYFVIKLPALDVFEYSGDRTGIVENEEDTAGTIGKIGDFEYKFNGQYLIKFTNQKALGTTIKGKTKLVGTVKKTNADIQMNDNDPSNPTEPLIIRQPNNPGPYKPRHLGVSWYNNDGKLEKGGEQSTKETLRWRVEGNKAQLRDILNNGNVEERKDVLIEDTLPDGLEFDETYLSLYTRVYLMTEDDKMSLDYIGYRTHIAASDKNKDYYKKWTSNPTYDAKEIEVIKENETDGKKLDIFREEIKQKALDYGINTNNIQKFVAGIYKHSDGRSTLIFPWGDSPKIGIKYHDLYGGENSFDDMVDSVQVNEIAKLSSWITSAQAAKTKAAYDGKNVMNFVLEYNVKVAPKYQRDGQTFRNEANLSYLDTQGALKNESKNNSITFVLSTSQGARTPLDLVVSKKWQEVENSIWATDKTNSSEIIKVQLYANGEKVNGKELELKKENNWTNTFKNLPIYENTDKIKYTVEEIITGNPDYEPVYGETNYSSNPYRIEIKNVKKSTIKRTIKVDKVWIGMDNWKEDKKNNASVEVKLYDKSDLSKTAIQTCVLNKDNNWDYEFTVPKYDMSDRKIDYAVEEINNSTPDYKTQVVGDMEKGFEIRNIQTTVKNIKVTKKWDNSDSAWHNDMQNTSVRITLLADGIPKENKTVSNSTSWTATFIDMPIYDDVGKVINYTTKETVIYTDNTEKEFAPIESRVKSADGISEEITLTNIKPTTTSDAVLRINKEIKGYKANIDDVFTFRANFFIDEVLDNTAYKFTRNDGTTSQIKSGETFTLTGGQHIVIRNLPDKIKYRIEETDYKKYTPKRLFAEKTITTSTQLFYEETFINERTTQGMLRIEKKVMNSSDKNKEFDFTVTIGDDVNKKYSFVGSKKGDIYGKDTIKLKNGEYIIIKEIEAGDIYKVEERNYSSEGYSTKVNGEDKREFSGKVESDEISVVRFVNTLSAGGIGGGDYPDPITPGSGGGGETPNTPTTPTIPNKPTTPTNPTMPNQKIPVNPTNPRPTIPTTSEEPNNPITPDIPKTPSVPSYPINSLPDPKAPNSPKSIIVVDENGVPIGTYTKRVNPDGTVEYVNENGIPLGGTKLVKTGNEFPENKLIITSMFSLLGLVILRRYRRKDK